MKMKHIRTELDRGGTKCYCIYLNNFLIGGDWNTFSSLEKAETEMKNRHKTVKGEYYIVEFTTYTMRFIYK